MLSCYEHIFSEAGQSNGGNIIRIEKHRLCCFNKTKALREIISHFLEWGGFINHKVNYNFYKKKINMDNMNFKYILVCPISPHGSFPDISEYKIFSPFP